MTSGSSTVRCAASPVLISMAGFLARLSRAILIDADLTGADLRGADLRGATLRWATLEQTNLRGADLEGADLEGADLERANLIRANLQGANLTGANLTNAEYGQDTRWPAGFDPQQHGAKRLTTPGRVGRVIARQTGIREAGMTPATS